MLDSLLSNNHSARHGVSTPYISGHRECEPAPVGTLESPQKDREKPMPSVTVRAIVTRPGFRRGSAYPHPTPLSGRCSGDRLGSPITGFYCLPAPGATHATAGRATQRRRTTWTLSANLPP